MSIHAYVHHADLAGVARELAAGVAVNAREPVHGRTPLMTAAASPSAGLTMVRFLVEQGADVNAQSWTPETAPESVAATMAPESIKYQFSGDTALMLAASTCDIEIVRFLLDTGADVHATTTFGYDALINAIFGGTRRAGTVGALVGLLLSRGATTHHVTTYGETALRTAAGFAMFDVVARLLAAGADASQLRWTPLHSAVVFGSLADVHAELAASAALETRDAFGRTALHLSLQVGELDKAQALRAAGAELAVGSSDARSPLVYAITPGHAPVLAWLLADGCDPEAASSVDTTPLMEAVEAGAVDAVRLLIDAGARVDRTDQYGQQPIAEAQDLEVVQVLLAHGAEFNDVADAVRPALFGIAGNDALNLPRETYLAGKERRFGLTNPEVMAVPFWHAMVRCRAAAYAARSRFDDTKPWGDTPVWCFQRFGRTLTALPDGRYVEIAGEHEDSYDPDFCIYNDVVVYHGNGDFTLYGYPEDVFSPTDFHTATVVGSSIYLIGSLGYRGTRRHGETPAYRLSVDTWAIEPVATGGSPPGWISRHSAVYDSESNRIIVTGGKLSVSRGGGSTPGEDYVDNTASYALDLATMTWRKLRA